MQIPIPEILSSKKFGAAAIAAVISFLGIREGFTVEQVALVTGPLYAYIGGQALADFGKEAKKASTTTNISS